MTRSVCAPRRSAEVSVWQRARLRERRRLMPASVQPHSWWAFCARPRPQRCREPGTQYDVINCLSYMSQSYSLLVHTLPVTATRQRFCPLHMLLLGHSEIVFAKAFSSSLNILIDDWLCGTAITQVRQISSQNELHYGYDDQSCRDPKRGTRDSSGNKLAGNKEDSGL